MSLKKSWIDKYKDKCKNMIFNPIFDGDYFTEYPKLAAFKCSIPEMHKNDYIRYCSLVLDPNSPYVYLYPDLKERRENVKTDISYFASNDYEFEVKLLLNIYRSNDWILYCSEQNVFYEFIERVNKPIETEGMDEEKQMKAVMLKDKYLDSLDKYVIRLEARFKKMFMHDEDLIKTAKRVALTPEMVAKGEMNV